MAISTPRVGKDVWLALGDRLAQSLYFLLQGNCSSQALQWASLISVRSLSAEVSLLPLHGGFVLRRLDISWIRLLYLCHLNACTKKHSYTPPRIQEALESLVGAGHFSCLDLKSGFWQIKMEEASKQYTAFTACPLGSVTCWWLFNGLCRIAWVS